ncbi:TonB-dependent receptor [Zhouia sp. PK063]|uniref:TonB-dependent receptor n=1 Tax=Zhouia sp. PK063 TaxID=3373602 RepID=UPI0037BDBAF0
MTKIYFYLLCVCFSVSFASAQEGNIKGNIIDESNLSVPGATVVITSLNKGVVSNFDGEFTFVNIPEGTYTLTVKYLGYSDVEKEVTVNVGTTSEVKITLHPKSVELNDVEVTGFALGGQAKALNTQKNNRNITNVISTDQIGKFPDANAGDALKRVTGVTMQVDQGEARNIIIRGLAPQLNSVTLNGSRIPSAEGDNRNVQMDLIPSDMIQTIEVNKAVTPDMDADALGGSVNLITRSSPNAFRVSATLGSGISFIRDKRILNGSFLVGDKSKNGKFGWMLSASLNDVAYGSDNVEAEWANEFAYENAAGDKQELNVNPYNNSFEIRKYIVQRIRRSFSASTDYKIDNNNTIYFKGMYNWRDDRENRYRLKEKILKSSKIGEDDFTLNGNTLTSFPVEGVREIKAGINDNRNKNARLEDQRMQNYSLGGDHLFGDLKFNWMASYAKASEERKNERYLSFANTYEVYNDVTTPRYPIDIPVDQASQNPNNFEFDGLTEEYQYTEEKDANVFANFELPANLLGNGGAVKLGARARFKKKDRDNNFFEYEPLNDNLTSLGQLPYQDYSDANYLAGSKYQVGNFVPASLVGALNLQDANAFEKSDVPDEYVGDNFLTKENVYAAYIMTTQDITDKLSVVAGVRAEHTKLKATGNEIEDEENVTGQITSENSYTNILPDVLFKYNVSANTVLRLSWTNTLARPNYVDLVPRIDTRTEDEEIYLGNPNLDATKSMNFDFMAEHYFSSVGIISAGAFYKDIRDFVYTFKTKNADNFDVFQPQNGDNASVYGVEASFQRQLDFLPGFLKNFGVYLNYTYLKSEAKGIRNEDGEERKGLDLPGTSPNMFNGSLGYTGKRFTARISANYSDAYLDEVVDSDFTDVYYDEQFFVDINASFSINKHFRIYADLTNLTNQPLRYYQGSRDYTKQLEYYGRRLNLGLKYDLF